MRVVSLIILLAIVGGVAFCFIHDPTRNKIKSWFFEAAHQAEGYAYAKTPKEAMEQFEKAIRTRNFKAAARYVTADYAKELEKSHDAGNAVGTRLDKIYEAMNSENKDLLTPMAVDLLINMDPFPDTFKIKGEVKETKKGETAEGQFEFVPRGKNVTGRAPGDIQRKQLDPKIYGVHNLRPNTKKFFEKVTITFDKKNEAWKIDFAPRVEEADYFVEHHRRYVTAYDSYLADLIKERTVLLRENGDTELFNVMSKSAK